MENLTNEIKQKFIDTNKKLDAIFDTFFVENKWISEIILQEWKKIFYKKHWKTKIHDIDWLIEDKDIQIYQMIKIAEKTDKWMQEQIASKLNNKWHYNYAYTYSDIRFRINWSKCQGKNVMNIRKINNEILRPKEIGIPEKIMECISEYSNWGIVIVSAPPGSWKSTTIASIVNEIACSRESFLNIITLEDPIEFIYKDTNSFILQREKWFDFNEYQAGIESTMRQLPDIVVVQEMATPDIIRDVMLLAEKWILVLTTLHTPDVRSIFDSVLSSFDYSRRRELLYKIANNLKVFISQRLIPRENSEGLIASFEYVTPTSEVKWYIKEDKINNIEQIMDIWPHMLFWKDLLKKIELGEISINNALKYCPHSQIQHLKDWLGIN